MSNPSSKFTFTSTTFTILCFCIFLTISCSNYRLETKSNSQVTNTPIIEDSLEKKAKKLTELYENKNCKDFFNAFPDNFREFNQLYGFDDEKGGRILFSEPEHITYFFSCAEISDRERLEKSIEIGINGRWEADLISMFQNSTFNLVKDHSDEAKEILDNLSDEKASSFWYFLFDGPHPVKEKESVDLLINLLGKDSKQSKLLSQQFQKLKVDWENH